MTNDKYYLIYTFNTHCKECKYAFKVFYIGTDSHRKEDALVYNETVQQSRSVIKYIPQYNRTVFNVDYIDAQRTYNDSNDCIYMSYFAISEHSYKNIVINNEYKLTYDDDHFEVKLKWRSFFTNEEYQHVMYLIYIYCLIPKKMKTVSITCVIF